MVLCESHSSYSRNLSSEFDAPVNQHDHAASMRNLFVGEQVFQRRGVCGQVFPIWQKPLLAFAPICARPE